MLETERLILRKLNENDADAIFNNWASDPEVTKYVTWPPHKSVEDSLNIIKTVFSKRETYAIVKDDVPIGCVGLLFHPDTNHWWGEGAAELGYWIGEEYWGNGYAFEASQALVKRAFDELGVKEIYASYRIENNQSKRVLEKLGFEYYSELTNENYLGEFFQEIAMKLEK